jgi:hypothetical protein
MATKSLFSLSSGCYFKQAGDECDLTYDVSFIYPSHLPFPQHVHDLISLQGSPRGRERKEAHPELDEPFQEAIVLLDQVVEVLTLP